ncbi:hypothetical protein K1719_032768 [Acacia pycnantha]|nr:hypothetical protein K1719_032768 [Acacia pycnantha]
MKLEREKVELRSIAEARFASVKLEHETAETKVRSAATTKDHGGAVDMSEGLGVALPRLNPLQIMIKPRLSFELYQQL